MSLDLSDWLRERREEVEEYEFSDEDTLGEWPGEVSEKGSISLHLDVLSGYLDVLRGWNLTEEVFLGSARII